MIADLEAWLIGTARQLDAAEQALCTIGRIVQPDDPAYRHVRHRLSGDDTGRYRLYAMIAVSLTAKSSKPTAVTAGSAEQTVIDLPANRRTAA